MKKIEIADITLKSSGDYSLNFKEKVEIAKQLDKLNADVIETAPLTGGKTDIVLLHTLAGVVKNSTLSVCINPEEAELLAAAEALKGAAKPAINILAPVSPVQMEYMCRKKPDAMIETVCNLIEKAKLNFPTIELTLLDATRAEHDFLVSIINAAIKSGASAVTLCDATGEMLPSEFGEFVASIKAGTILSEKGILGVMTANELHMSAACAATAVENGADRIKTTMLGKDAASLKTVAGLIRAKGDRIGISSTLNMTVLESCVKQVVLMTEGKSTETASSTYSTTVFRGDEDITAIAEAIKKLGYDLSDDDVSNVYSAFVKNADKKEMTAKDLDAIIASEALQVPPTYKLDSYVVNIGNIITPMAHVKLIKNEVALEGLSVGDGSVDAAFKAIEQIVGHHLELDDFQVQSVTRGREALGSSVVKLRSNGKLYSGKGISTDIVGASINAYINALNKICFEEEM